MKPLSDAVIAHLRRVTDWPEPEGTRYRIRERLGQGGMGTIYLAEDLDLDREVAFKVLSDIDPSPDAAERMLREARIIARLEHPGIVPVHEVGRLADGRIYYMKRVRGSRWTGTWRPAPRFPRGSASSRRFAKR
jgi:serine/threonine protein kinase